MLTLDDENWHQDAPWTELFRWLEILRFLNTTKVMVLTPRSQWSIHNDQRHVHIMQNFDGNCQRMPHASCDVANTFYLGKAINSFNSNNAPPEKRRPTSKRTYHQQTDVPPASAFPNRP